MKKEIKRLLGADIGTFFCYLRYMTKRQKERWFMLRAIYDFCNLHTEEIGHDEDLKNKSSRTFLLKFKPANAQAFCDSLISGVNKAGKKIRKIRNSKLQITIPENFSDPDNKIA